MARSLNAVRFVFLVLGSLLAGVGILFLGRLQRPLPITWLGGVAVAGIFSTVFVGSWAKRQNRFSWGLSLILGGNMLCFGSILVPFDVTVRSFVLTIGALLYVLAFLLRFLKLIGLAAKK
jgi:hypothetical protein